MHLVVAGDPLTFTATLPGEPSSVPVARRLVRSALPGCPRADDLLLAITELASNAVLHSASGRGGTFTMQIRTVPCWARINVADEGPTAGPGVPGNGWGLAIVADVTDRNGAIIAGDGRRL
jgi:anti-sigma regulatory factor (Ser/Thr protein kinase)